jgi:hypothetical protein
VTPRPTKWDSERNKTAIVSPSAIRQPIQMSDTTATLLQAEAATFTRRTFFGLFAPSVTAYTHAADLYNRAAALLKSTRSWVDAATAYGHAADCFAASGATSAQLYAKADQIKMLFAAGQIDTAHTALQTELHPLVRTIGDYDLLVMLITEVAPPLETSHTETAISLYRMSIPACYSANLAGSAIRMSQNLGRMLATVGRYGEAAAVLEDVAHNPYSNGSGSGSIQLIKHGYTAIAILLTLAHTGDIALATTKQTELRALDTGHMFARRWLTTDNVLNAVRTGDVTQLNQILADTTLESWIAGVIRHIRDHLAAT